MSEDSSKESGVASYLKGRMFGMAGILASDNPGMAAWGAMDADQGAQRGTSATIDFKAIGRLIFFVYSKPLSGGVMLYFIGKANYATFNGLWNLWWPFFAAVFIGIAEIYALRHVRLYKYIRDIWLVLFPFAVLLTIFSIQGYWVSSYPFGILGLLYIPKFLFSLAVAAGASLLIYRKISRRKSI